MATHAGAGIPRAPGADLSRGAGRGVPDASAAAASPHRVSSGGSAARAVRARPRRRRGSRRGPRRPRRRPPSLHRRASSSRSATCAGSASSSGSRARSRWAARSPWSSPSRRRAAIRSAGACCSATWCRCRRRPSFSGSCLDRHELDSPHGRSLIGILIFQDLAVVPMLLSISGLRPRRIGRADADPPPDRKDGADRRRCCSWSRAS